MSEASEGIFARLTVTGNPVELLIGTRVYPVKAPQNVTTPYVVFQRISAPRETAFGADPGMVRARFQFTVFSSDFDQMEAVRTAVRQQLERFRGTSAGVEFDDVFVDNDQDLWDEDTQRHMGTLDLMVLYREAP